MKMRFGTRKNTPRIFGIGARSQNVGMKMPLNEPSATPFELYEYAQDHAIWIDLNAKGRIIAGDRDRLELPNRLSTNHLLKLKTGEWAHTIFTTSIARIIDRATVFNVGDEAIYITGEGRGVQ